MDEPLAIPETPPFVITAGQQETLDRLEADRATVKAKVIGCSYLTSALLVRMPNGEVHVIYPSGYMTKVKK